MMADSRFSVEHELCDCEVPIFDMNGYSLRHLTKTVLGVLRIYMKFVQEAHPVRIRQIHVINCPSYLDKVMMVAKPFIKGEVFKLVIGVGGFFKWNYLKIHCSSSFVFFLISDHISSTQFGDTIRILSTRDATQ